MNDDHFLGHIRTKKSVPFRLDVHGKPQVLRVQTGSVQPFQRKSNARLEAYFCSDPRPVQV